MLARTHKVMSCNFHIELKSVLTNQEEEKAAVRVTGNIQDHFPTQGGDKIKLCC